MKRILLAAALFLLGGAGIVELNGFAHRAEERLHASISQWNAQSQRLTELGAEKDALMAKLRDYQSSLQKMKAVPASDLAFLAATNGILALTQDQWEKLKEEAEIHWDSSSDWVLLNKATLPRLDVTAVRQNQVSDTAASLLSMTPEERQRLNDAFVQTREAFAEWAKASLQREGPDGQMLVRYTIPSNPELGQNLTNRLASAIGTTLGPERAELFQLYARDWYQVAAGGLGDLTSILTISRRGTSEKSELFYQFDLEGGPGARGQSDKVDPRSPYFPPAFQSIFPGHWRELIEREGLDL